MGDGRTRYALVGTGVRGLEMFAAPILTAYADVAELVGLYDANPLRAEAARELLRIDVPLFPSFDDMMTAARPDAVIVTTKDSTHHRYIVGALRAGADAITEKPMTTDDAKCREILAAQRETGRQVRVTFNYRHTPYFTKVKELLADGAIGDVLWSTSTGTSTGVMGPTTSGGGIGGWRTAAGSWSTRPRTTSTS